MFRMGIIAFLDDVHTSSGNVILSLEIIWKQIDILLILKKVKYLNFNLLIRILKFFFDSLFDAVKLLVM